MKVLVLGGTGFVGSHVARAFARAGHQVAIGLRPQSPRDLVADLDVEHASLDLRDEDGLVAAFRGRDLVVHAAGLLSLWPSQSDELYRTNVRGTRNVVEACLRAGVGRLLYDGSVGVYSGTRTPLPVDERGAPDAARFHSFHVVSMALAEAEVWKGLARGLDAVLLHPPLCFGRGDRSLHSSWVLLALAHGHLALVPPGGLSAVDVLDVARAHVLAATRAPRGGNYLLGGENLTNTALVELFADVLGVPAHSVTLSRRGMQALGVAAEWLARLRGQDHGANITLNEALGTAMSLYWFVDDRRARAELGHGASPLRPAVERQVAWLRERGYIGDSGLALRELARRFLRAE